MTALDSYPQRMDLNFCPPSSPLKRAWSQVPVEGRVGVCEHGVWSTSVRLVVGLGQHQTPNTTPRHLSCRAFSFRSRLWIMHREFTLLFVPFVFEVLSLGPERIGLSASPASFLLSSSVFCFAVLFLWCAKFCCGLWLGFGLWHLSLTNDLW